VTVPGYFPGEFVSTLGIYCTDQETAHNISNFCYFSGNDGYSNNPQCVVVSCPQLFGSCLINDKINNRAIQIGGSDGVVSYDLISILDIQNGSIQNSSLYGTLSLPLFDVGCDFLPNQHRSLIGGRSDNETINIFHNEIQICNQNDNCKIQSLVLPQHKQNESCEFNRLHFYNFRRINFGYLNNILVMCVAKNGYTCNHSLRNYRNSL